MRKPPQSPALIPSFSRGLTAPALLLAAVAILFPRPLGAQAPDPGARWSHIKTALYCTGEDVERLLTKPDDRRATLKYFAPLRLSKVYLQNDSYDPSSVATLRDIAADLRSQGLEVSGAVVPAGEKGPLCYNDPADMAHLEAKVTILAQVFDEIIVDDWLFTNCTCPKCVAGRGSDSWADYRSRLVAEQSKLHMIDAARKVNPSARVIIKYPNWYEGHRFNGYDVARQTPQFAGVSVGIETRQRATHEQHIPTYSGYVFQKWIGGDAGPKWRSSWLDNYEMQGDDNDFVAEVWQAVLAQTPEIIFWCAGGLHPPTPSASNYTHLVELMPEFDRLAGLLKGPARGIPIDLPMGSTGEYNVFGYLGMIGLPLAPVSSFPAEAKAALFTQHSLRDPKLAGELLGRIEAGREIFLTWPLLQDLKGTEVGRSINVIAEGGTVSSSTFRIPNGLGGIRPLPAARSFTFPKIEVSTWPDVRTVGLVREDGDFGVLLGTHYIDGQVDVLNLPENTYDLIGLPEEVLNSVRKCFSDELGVRLVGPGGVALYLFGSSQFVLYNMSDAPARVSLRQAAAKPAHTWSELLHGKPLSVTAVDQGEGSWATHETDVALTLLPFEVALVESR